MHTKALCSFCEGNPRTPKNLHFPLFFRKPRRKIVGNRIRFSNRTLLMVDVKSIGSQAIDSSYGPMGVEHQSMPMMNSPKTETPLGAGSPSKVCDARAYSWGGGYSGGGGLSDCSVGFKWIGSFLFWPRELHEFRFVSYWVYMRPARKKEGNAHSGKMG